MPLAKPTIVLVGGAWYEVYQYNPLVFALRAAGHTVSTPALATVNGEQEDFSEDVFVVREAIVSATEAGNDVVVLMHSYGGVVGSEAVQGLSRLDRSGEDREKGSVVQMIYLSAFAIPEGICLLDAFGGKPLPWWEDAGKAWRIIDTQKILFNDVGKSKADELAAQLNTHAKGAFTSKATYAAWKHIESTYIICENDNAIPVEIQEAMCKQDGNKFRAVRLDATHIPWITKLDETVAVIREIIR
ncbi:hypothetical protein BDV97DRAFT_363034 [Delphinella strobiligena]|nr:hypothetical protein BDV97DRAFT_363034 [Delphinella strobiligena]